MINSKKKSIVFINQSSGYLMIDIINEHIRNYKEVVLITGFVNPRNIPLANKVKVHQITEYNRKSMGLRLLSWVIFSIRSLFIIIAKYPKSDLYIVSNPPTGVCLGVLLKRNITHLIYDVYPDALSQYNFLNPNSFIFKLWVWVNKQAYKRSEMIYTISDGMKQLLLNYVVDERVKVVPIWTDNTFLKPIERNENSFLRNHGLEQKFIIMYSGNIGLTHPVEVLLIVAERLLGKDVTVVIIGEGEKKRSLVKIKEKKELTNVEFLPFQSMNTFPKSLAAASIGVVTLGGSAANLSVPSKLFNIMSVGVPVLGVGSPNSELANIIEEYEIGECFLETDLDLMVIFIEKLIKDKALYKKLSDNSLYASKKFTNANANELIFPIQ